VKKKLAGLDKRIQLGGVVLVLILFAAGAYKFVISPQHAEAAKLQTQADLVQTQIFQRRAALRAAGHPPTIETADLFRLTRAMPDRVDMPGIILTLSEVARAAGIKFALIEPAGTPTQTGAYETDRIHLLFNGDFYGLTDFLYRIRSLVSVRDGELDARGRLFTVDTVTFSVTANAFPKISAELFVNAYVYGTPAAPAASTPATTTPSTTPATPSEAPDGATAAGATP
jgi:Tfp pilus assembly protein PilO